MSEVRRLPDTDEREPEDTRRVSVEAYLSRGGEHVWSVGLSETARDHIGSVYLDLKAGGWIPLGAFVFGPNLTQRVYPSRSDAVRALTAAYLARAQERAQEQAEAERARTKRLASLYVEHSDR